MLHYNKSIQTLLGHLGSAAQRKADAVIQLSKDKDDENISLVEPVFCREKEFRPFAFSILENGLPYIIENYPVEKNIVAQKAMNLIAPKALTYTDFDEAQHIEILFRLFSEQKKYLYSDLWNAIKKTVGTIAGKTVGDNSSKGFVAYYLSNGWIRKTGDGKRDAFYIRAADVPGTEQGGFPDF